MAVKGPLAFQASDRSIVAIAAVISVGGVLWLAGAASALMTGHSVPRDRPLAGMTAFAHLGDPSLAWHGQVGPAALYWAITVALVVVVVISGAMLLRAARKKSDEAPRSLEGLATRRQVAAAGGLNALLVRASTLRPSIRRPTATDLGYRLGRSAGIDCWASVEDSILLVGPPRSGKGTSVMIPMILDAPGPVVTTSTRSDNLMVTLAARRRTGCPVAVFDPQALIHPSGLLPTLRWSVVRGCENAQTAMMRAEALVPDGGRSGLENGTFWRQQGLSVVRCLLHAAALDGRSSSDLYRWSHSPARAKEAVTILAHANGATDGWDLALDGVMSADFRTRDSIWAMVANTFAPLADPTVLTTVSPREGEEFDPLSFLRDNGTLYLLGTASGASATASIVVALIEDVVDAARRRAAKSQGTRLDPPLGLLLDEAANYPLPSLPSLMSEGGGSGITTVAALQSLAQARDRWGREAAGAIWDSAIVKIVLGGSANADDLAAISRLIGDREVRELTRTTGARGGGSSVSVSVRRHPILEPSAIRQLAVGQALMLLRSAPPIVMNLTPWTERSDAEELHRDRRTFEETMTTAIDA